MLLKRSIKIVFLFLSLAKIPLIFLFCSKVKEDELRVRLNLVKIVVGTSSLKFEEILQTSGFLDIKEELISQKEFKVNFGQDFISDSLYVKFKRYNGYQVIEAIALNLDFDYKKDILPFIEFWFECQDGERFFGFGEWSDYADATGLTREIWTQEQHVGRGNDSDPPFPVNRVTTYFPVPFFISSRNYAFFLTGYARMEFSMCENDKYWKAKIYDSVVNALVFRWEKKPLEAVEKFTEIVGRQKVPPLWAFGNWIDEIFGQENVLNTVVWLRKNKIPSSAIWTEDWAGGRWTTPTIYNIGGWDTEHSRELYPEIERLSQELKKFGFKFLGYFNTFVPDHHKSHAESREKDILFRDRDGNIRYFWTPEGRAAIVDILSETGAQYMKDVMKKIADLGFSGWMADFGEWVLPSFISGGKTGWEFRNLYPYLWAKINYEFWESYSPGDYVFFSRSGFTGSWKFSPVVWQGDQNTSFERFDGLGALVPQMTSVGMAGVANVGPDIAGYTTLFSGPSDKELYIRWTSLCAFVPIFRTHHGTEPKRNWRFDKDTETTLVFKRWAEEHIRLAPTFYELSKIAQSRGYPIVRHIFLEYPEVVKYLPEKLEVIEQQFLIGDSLLVAPIVKRGETKREVFIPPGIWFNYFSRNESFSGGENGKFIEIEVPVGEIFVVVKKGSCIKVFDPIPHTLLQVSADVKEQFEITDISNAEIKEICF